MTAVVDAFCCAAQTIWESLTLPRDVMWLAPVNKNKNKHRSRTKATPTPISFHLHLNINTRAEKKQSLCGDCLSFFTVATSKNNWIEIDQVVINAFFKVCNFYHRQIAPIQRESGRFVLSNFQFSQQDNQTKKRNRCQSWDVLSVVSKCDWLAL